MRWMKLSLLILVLAFGVSVVGCKNEPATMSAEEKAKSEQKMKDDMKSMMQSLPKNPGSQPAPGGTTTP